MTPGIHSLIKPAAMGNDVISRQNPLSRFIIKRLRPVLVGYVVTMH